jgi:hypothetical protein
MPAEEGYAALLVLSSRPVDYRKRTPWRDYESRRRNSAVELKALRSKAQGNQSTGGWGMWIWIVGASVVFAVPFFTFAWKTK